MVLSDGEVHDDVPVGLTFTDCRRPELEPGREADADADAVVKETTFAEGCTKRVSTLSAEGDADGEDRNGCISLAGRVCTRRTPG